jgi:hypothetical protein
MTTPKDGGPAFPIAEYHPLGEKPRYELGMSLRDWFAGMALSGQLAHSNGTHLTLGPTEPNDNDRLARVVYALADAMLRVREGV